MSLDSSSFVCQLATHFSCHCLKCTGGFFPISTTSSYNTNNNISTEDLYQLQFTTTVSAPTSVISYTEEISTTETLHNEEEEGEEEDQKFSSSVSTSSASSVVVVEAVPVVEEVTPIVVAVKEEEPKKLSRRQRKQQHQKSFLDVARSLRDSPKLFRNKPAHIAVSQNFYSEQAEQYFLSRLDDQYRAKRRQFKRLRRRQYLPAWCYNQNDNSLRSLREMCCVFVGGAEEFKIYDRRAITSTWRLPRSTALAHRDKNRWIVRNKIFNCRKPFANVYNWSDDACLNKPDTRGLVQFERDCKFLSKDGRQRYNRNGGRHRNASRGNGYHQGRQVYMGNSRKTIFGKPWLFMRQKRMNKGKDRLAEFFGNDYPS